jgi:putative transposase
MLRFRRIKSLQKLASAYASLHNHFNHEHHLVDRQTYKARRSAALVEWQSLVAGVHQTSGIVPLSGDEFASD